MSIKKSLKKFASLALAATFGLSLTFPLTPLPTAQALDLNDAVKIGATLASANAQKKQIEQAIEYLNETEEGRQELYQTFRKQKGVNNDPTLNARLDKIMNDLTNAVGQVDPTVWNKPYLHFISEDKSLNAACGMGHVMMVNVGTFSYISSDDEIAAIVGHEMGHGQKDHVAKGMKKNLNKQVIANIANTAAGGTALTSVIGGIALKQSVAHSDRNFEWEADNLAFEYIIRTNYNPGACAAVMQKFVELLDNQGGKVSKAMSFLNPSDHPDSDKRRDNYVKKLQEYSGGKVFAQNGKITVNGKDFITVAGTSSMSGAERSYFVLGNLAAAYHNGQNNSEAKVVNGTVLLGNQPIITPVAGDEDASIIAEKLNAIK